MRSTPHSENADHLTQGGDLQLLAQKTLVIALVLGGTFLVAWGILAALDVMLLVFGGLLVAILLRSMTKQVRRLTGLTSLWSLGLVLTLLAIAVVGLLWLLIPPLLEQFAELVEKLPQA